VERAAGDEQDVVGLHHAVLGRHRGAFDQRQQVALHALARHVAAVGVRAGGDLVDLVEEHDAVLLDCGQRLLLGLLVVDQAPGFLLGQQLHRLAHLELAGLATALPEVGEHALQLLRQVLHPGGVKISMLGLAAASSISMSLPSSWPSRSIFRKR